MINEKNKALLVVDIQNDFCSAGTLPVKGGESIIPFVNEYVQLFKKNKDLIIFSRDWHPRKTNHFNTNGGQWPEHCIQNTAGARFHSDLKVPSDALIVSKGQKNNQDSYSAFHGKDKSGKSLDKILRQENIESLYICGLATDYCVKSSVLDALKQKYSVYLLDDAIRGVNLKPADSQIAIKEMKSKGATLIKYFDLII